MDYVASMAYCNCFFLVSQTHLPGYVEDYDSIKAKGVDVIVCVSVNDAFVMTAWGESRGATGKIRMLADPAGEFTKVYSSARPLGHGHFGIVPVLWSCALVVRLHDGNCVSV